LEDRDLIRARRKATLTTNHARSKKQKSEFGDHPRMAMPRDEARKAEFSGLLDNDAVAHEAAGVSVAAACSFISPPGPRRR
jgi:hypothetical protein